MSKSYVLQQLEINLFNDDIVPVLVERINRYQHEKDSTAVIEQERMKKQLVEVDKQINNIVTAITSGMFQQVFKEKMEELQKQKAAIQNRLEALEPDQCFTNITEGMLRSYFSLMKRYVHDRNFPEIKRMISSYIDKVVVYRDRIDVFYKVALPSNDNATYRFETDVGRDEVRTCWSKVG